MRSLLLLGLSFLFFGAPCLEAQGPSRVFDKQTDFSHYKTYSWASFANATKLGELTESQLKGTMQVALATKGLKRAPSDHADLYIAYQIVATDPKNLHTFDIEWPDGSKQGGVLGLGGTAMAMQTGELVLDFYDASTKELVWRSVVSKPIDLDGKPASRQKQLDKAAEKLLKHYPPE